MSFSQRSNLGRTPPPRNLLEEAPGDLRATLLSLLEEDLGPLEGYRLVSRKLNRIPAPDVWGDPYALPLLRGLIDKLEWFEVFDLLEDACSGDSNIDQVNASFIRCGLAYEIYSRGSRGEIGLWDPEGAELGVSGIEQQTVPMLVGRFAPVNEQYQRAVLGINGRPMNLEKAVSEALGSLEAVAHIISGKSDFAPAIDSVFASRSQSRALAEALKKLYGWASQLPGARHGRHAEPDLTLADATLAVRLCGVAIAFLLDEEM